MQVQAPRKKPFSLGMRAVKTLVSAGLITFLYALIGRNPCFACIGAVFGMGPQLKAGLKNGGNRVIGSIIGGVVAVLLYPLYRDGALGISGGVYLTLGLAVILIISQLLGADGGIQPGVVVFYVVLLTVPETRYVRYAIDRIIDTAIGVALSVGINALFPSPLEQEPIRFTLKHRREKA